MALTAEEQQERIKKFSSLYFDAMMQGNDRATHQKALEAFIDDMEKSGIEKTEKYIDAISHVEFDTCKLLLERNFPCSTTYLNSRVLGDPNQSGKNIRLFMAHATPEQIQELEKRYQAASPEYKIIIFIATDNLERFKALLPTASINCVIIDFALRLSDQNHTEILNELVSHLLKKFPNKNELIKEIGADFITLLNRTKTLGLSDTHTALEAVYDKESLQKEKEQKRIEDMGIKTPEKSKFEDLYNKIQTLEDYGRTLVQEQQFLKGNKVMSLAKDIRDQVKEYEKNPNTDEKNAIGNHLSKLISEGYKDMGKNRKIKDILGHILLALTGVGLAVMLYKKLTSPSQSIFVNKTHRQTLVNDIQMEFHSKKPGK